MYGKAKVGRPDWYMMGACIVFALTFSLRSVPLAVLLLLFMPSRCSSSAHFLLCCSSCRGCSFRPPASGSSAAR